MHRRVILTSALSIAALGLLVPSGAGAAAAEKPRAAKVTIEGVQKDRVTVGHKEGARVFVGPFVEGQEVNILLLNDGDVVERVTKRLRRVEGRNAGIATYTSPKLTADGRYVIRAIHHPTKEQRRGAATSPSLKVSFPDLDLGDSGPAVAVFNNLLEDVGYANTAGGDNYNAATGRAVHAFRKVNRMPRNEDANRKIFKMLGAGEGGFELKYPGGGKHVEVDITRQVMVLADDGEALYTYHVSTGAPATPTIPGHWQFYRKEPGVNNVGMINSVYYDGGYATHGYPSVPDYPASHGCTRNPPPDSLFIYNWIDIGDDIWLYH